MSDPLNSGLNLGALDDLLARGDAAEAYAPAAAVSEQKRALAEARAAKKGETVLDRALAAVDGERNLEGARLALEAIKEFPDAMAGYLAAAVALDRLGFVIEALAFYEQADKRAPNNPSICSLLGSTAERCDAPEIAMRCHQLAARLEPDNAAHIANLGGVLRDMGRYSEAIDVLRNQLYVTPTDADLWNTLGTVLQEQGEMEEAVTFLAEAARVKPNFARASHNLGTTLTDLGRYREASDALDHALDYARSDSDRAEMLHARGVARLALGRMGEGWDDYEARFDPLARDPIMFVGRRPRWEGDNLNGKHLLLFGEQGLGDEVLFMSAVPDVLRALGPSGKLTIACEHRLVPLVARSFPDVRVVLHHTGIAGSRKLRLVKDETIWDGVDCWAAMGAPLRFFRREVSAFPLTAGFLRPDPQRVADMRAKLGCAGGLKIGILWKSLVMTPKRRRYFAPIAAWENVLRLPNVSFFSLQPGDTAEDEAYVREKWGVTFNRFDGLDLKDDLDGIAAASSVLDLVIGPMAASTNIAAACGAPVWIMHRYGHWTMHATKGIPYYPHARVFVPPEQRWRAIFDDMARELSSGASLRAA